MQNSLGYIDARSSVIDPPNPKAKLWLCCHMMRMLLGRLHMLRTHLFRPGVIASSNANPLVVAMPIFNGLSCLSRKNLGR